VSLTALTMALAMALAMALVALVALVALASTACHRGVISTRKHLSMFHVLQRCKIFTP